jgi:hypothetical protein
MSLHIIIGFDSNRATAMPHMVYVGRSGDEARAAQERSGAACFQVFHNPIGIRKNNPRAGVSVPPSPVSPTPSAGGRRRPPS